MFTPEARVITLEQNYRSTQPMSESLQQGHRPRERTVHRTCSPKRQSTQKPFITIVRDGTAQAQHVADEILKAHNAGIPLKSQAVLFRASQHSGQLEIELAKRNIAFVKWGGNKFIDAAHIKDALSVLRWCENPRDRIAAFRAVQLLPGIGPATATAMFAKISGLKFDKELSSISPPTSASSDWRKFVKVVSRTWKEREPWPTQFHSLCRWLGPQIRNKYDDNVEGRLNDLDQLAQIAATFPSRQTFLAELTLDPPDVTSNRKAANDSDDDTVVLSTIHSAKGQEWKHVYVLNVIDGCIPHGRAGTNVGDLEEERRLLHVAMTRAKDHLDLIVPQFHFSIRESVGGDMSHLTKPTQFIPRRFNKHFECRVLRVSPR